MKLNFHQLLSHQIISGSINIDTELNTYYIAKCTGKSDTDNRDDIPGEPMDRIGNWTIDINSDGFVISFDDMELITHDFSAATKPTCRDSWNNQVGYINFCAKGTTDFYKTGDN